MVVDSSSLLSKYLGEKEGNSVKFMQRMLYLIFSEVVYQRELLPREHFTEKHVFGCEMHVPDPTRDRRQVALHKHLRGAAEAVTDKRLKQYHLMVHADRNDPSAAAEVFIMEVIYADDDSEASMQMSCGSLSNVRVCYNGVEELQNQTRNVFRCLRKGLATLERITHNVSFSFYIMYRDGVDRAYHPAGYGQAARMYALPENAEIGDMGMLHAKEHACLLKVKSLMLEDGFQLMQGNAATQRTQSESLASADPSEEGSNDPMSSDKVSSFGVFDDHSEWDEEESQGGKRDQRSARDQRSRGGEASTRTIRFEEEASYIGGDSSGEEALTPLAEQRPAARRDQRSARRDQRSLTEASAATIRFEQTGSIIDRSMSEESDEASVELGTARDEDFPTLSQSPVKSGGGGRGDTTEETGPSTFASTVSIVTKKLAAADKKRAEQKEKEKEKEKSPNSSRSTDASTDRRHSSKSGGAGSEEKSSDVTPSDRSHSSTSRGTGSEGSENAPSPVRRVSLTKRKSLSKVPEESTESDEEPSKKRAEDPDVPAAPKAKELTSGGGKEADSGPSVDTVSEKAAAPRGRAARRKGSVEKAATVPEESMEVDQEKEIVEPPKKQTNRRGKKAAELVEHKDEENTVAAKVAAPRGRAARRKGSVEKAATVPQESMEVDQEEEEIAVPTPKNQKGKRGKSATPRTPADSMETNDPSSSEVSTGRRDRSGPKAAKKPVEETPKRGRKRLEELPMEVRTPGEGPIRARQMSQ